MKKSIKKEISLLAKEISGDRKTVASFAVAIAALIGSVATNLMQIVSEDTSAATEQTQNMTFEVGVNDTIAVSITAPDTAATGNAGEFLRNTVAVDVSTNASNGFTASMYSKDTTDLVHTNLGSGYTIPTLTSNVTRNDFINGTNSAPDHWGYSLGEYSLNGSTQTSNGDTSAGLSSGVYSPLVSTSASPITIMDGATTAKSSGSRNVYFGARAGASTTSGTYENTVVISVVTGNVDASNPITPTNPVNPTTDIANNNTATYTGSTGTGATQGVGISGSTGTTVYTTTTRTSATATAPATTTTTTEVSGGDNTSTYAAPHGVTSTNDVATTFASTANQSNSALPIGLAITSGVTAAAGVGFFALAKFRDDDDEDEY